MLATIITDVFRKDETILIAAALDNLCSPKDNYGWASAGIYSFWDIRTKEIYYIGLALDLAKRFRQHTGLESYNPNGCKIQQITEHFSKNSFLGYSIFVQSCLNQPPTGKIKVVYRRLSVLRGIDYKDLAELGKEEIINAEGFLIEGYKRRYGMLPQWNKIGGVNKGRSYMMEQQITLCIQQLVKRRYITQDEIEDEIDEIEDEIEDEIDEIDSMLYEYAKKFLDCFTLINTGAFVARTTLRALSASPVLEAYEELILHPIRMLMLVYTTNFINAFKDMERWAIKNKQLTFIDGYEQILRAKYLKKRPNFDILVKDFDFDELEDEYDEYIGLLFDF
jgi:hypothetical protein